MLTSVSQYPISHWPGKSPVSVNTRTTNTDASAPSSGGVRTDTATQAQDQEKLKVIEALKARDREVKAHEQAHISASGGLAIGGASFNFQLGPDGKRYAIGGEVQIDTSPVAGDPSATLRKAETIRRAALAPANPSAQDYKVAAKAAQMAAKAQMDMVKLEQQSDAGSSAEEKFGPSIDLTV